MREREKKKNEREREKDTEKERKTEKEIKRKKEKKFPLLLSANFPTKMIQISNFPCSPPHTHKICVCI